MSRQRVNPSTAALLQSVTFKAPVQDVYETLMDTRKHARFTGARARISRKIGGKISAHLYVIWSSRRTFQGNKQRLARTLLGPDERSS